MKLSYNRLVFFSLFEIYEMVQKAASSKILCPTVDLEPPPTFITDEYKKKPLDLWSNTDVRSWLYEFKKDNSSLENEGFSEEISKFTGKPKSDYLFIYIDGQC